MGPRADGVAEAYRLLRRQTRDQDQGVSRALVARRRSIVGTKAGTCGTRTLGGADVDY